MSAITTDRHFPRREPPAFPSARVALKPPGSSPGLLDGAWWPRSRDLLRELPALIDALAPRWGRITHIAVNPQHWPVIPRKIPVTGHVVKAGWFKAEQDPHKLLLLSYTAGRWDLLVIPPETNAAAAARLMAAATDSTGLQLTASALMAAEEVLRAMVPAPHDTSAADRPQDREEAWEYEGGASSTCAAVGTARRSPLPMGM
ncbi:DUF5994 family protein [Streptomyces sp. NPDC006704]|uniref:DUF5994 family protein n=1 Tax=Streptomyces sp. NPDC006704 TaxID=3364760 RepID=UPI00369F5BE4